MTAGPTFETGLRERPLRSGNAFAGVLFVALVVAAGSVRAQAPSVQVRKHGELILIDVEMPVAAPSRTAWEVLTDYEHMASFLSNLTASRVLRRDANRLEVFQSGRTKVAFMTFSFEATRSVELVPEKEIRSQLVAGDFKSYASTTTVLASPAGALIVHHGEYVPKAWMPPMIGTAVIESETRKQYREIAEEIQRRVAASARVPPTKP